MLLRLPPVPCADCCAEADSEGSNTFTATSLPRQRPRYTAPKPPAPSSAPSTTSRAGTSDARQPPAELGMLLSAVDRRVAFFSAHSLVAKY